MIEDEIFDDLWNKVDGVGDIVVEYGEWVLAICVVILELLVILPFFVAHTVVKACRCVGRLLRGIGHSFMKGLRGDRT